MGSRRPPRLKPSRPEPNEKVIFLQSPPARGHAAGSLLAVMETAMP